MESERWRRINTLYHAALALPTPKRSVFLGNACSDDDIRREVESLLEAEKSADGFLSASAVETLAREIAERGRGTR